MADLAYHQQHLETLAKRDTKAQLVKWCARYLADADKHKDEAYARESATNAENVRLKLEVDRLTAIRKAVDAVLNLKGHPVPSTQLTMLLQSELDSNG